MAGSWQINTITSYPETSYYTGTCIVGDYIYCFGNNVAGVANNNCYKINTLTNQISPIATIPNVMVNTSYQNRWFAFYDSVHDSIHIFTSPEMTNQLYHQVFSIATQNFTVSESIQNSTSFTLNGAVALPNNKVLLFVHWWSGIDYDYVFEYDMTTNAYTQKLNTNQYSWTKSGNTHFIACLDEVLIVKADFTCYLYNATDKLYTSLGINVPHTYNRNQSISWTIGSKGFLYGDYSSGEPEAMTVFDFNTHTFGAPPLAGTTSRSAAHAVVKNGSVYIIGGRNGSTPVNTIEKFSYYLDKPTNITAQYIQGGGIKLDWVDNSTEESEYVIERKREDESVYSTLVILPTIAGVNYTYTDATADIINHSYQYKIKARLVIV